MGKKVFLCYVTNNITHWNRGCEKRTKTVRKEQISGLKCRERKEDPGPLENGPGS